MAAMIIKAKILGPALDSATGGGGSSGEDRDLLSVSEGASAGATIGSAIPGVGTLIGAVVGAGVGALAKTAPTPQGDTVRIINLVVDGQVLSTVIERDSVEGRNNIALT
jgi:hypothetical protein